MQVGAWQDQSCRMLQTLWGSVTPRWEVPPLPHLLALRLQAFRGPTAKPRGFSASWFWAAWWPLWSSRMSSRSSRTGARQWHPCPKALDPQEGTRKQPDPCELLTPMKTYQQANKSPFLQHPGVPQSVLGHSADPQAPFLTCQLPFALAVVLDSFWGPQGHAAGSPPARSPAPCPLVLPKRASQAWGRAGGSPSSQLHLGAAAHPSLALNSSPAPPPRSFIWAARRIACASPQVSSRCQISLPPDLPPSDKLRAGRDGEGAPPYLKAAAVCWPLSSPADRYAAKSTALGDINELVRRVVLPRSALLPALGFQGCPN